MIVKVNTEDKQFYYASTIEDYKESLNFNFKNRKQFTISTVNNLDIKMTDCSMMYDYMMSELNKAIILIEQLSSNELYEVITNLNKKGLHNMNTYLFKEWKQRSDIWGYRSIVKTLKLCTNMKQ